MALQIIVDGYNFIGGENGLNSNVEADRERLIGLLARYRLIKGFPVTVVFDGWRSGWSMEHEEHREGVRVVFSRHGEKADQVIERMAEELGEGCLVVSSDREIKMAVENSGAVCLDVTEFSGKVRGALQQTADSIGGDPNESGSITRPKKGNPKRLSKKDRKKQQRMRRL